jgi:hypothetical protein
MTTISVSGPLFSPNVEGKVKDAVREGIFDVAAEITGDVQEQLYAGHGWRTGRLRGSIAARQFSDLGFEVKSGALTGEPVEYAYWVETGKRRGIQTRFPGYHMFEESWRKWQANRRRIEQIMGRALVRALS